MPSVFLIRPAELRVARDVSRRGSRGPRYARPVSPEERVGSLVLAARRLADASDPLGREARRRLPEATGLSPENVELGLSRCLETQPGEQELSRLIGSVEAAPRALVLLSANVFVAAHRALALALAASPVVVVRASRREPVMAELLARAAGALFSTVKDLEPRPGDALWAYGQDETLAALRARLPAGVRLHAQGAGFGVALVTEAAFELDARGPSRASSDARDFGEGSLAERLALDVALFDQQGCLSPRVVVFSGGLAAARCFAEALAAALVEFEARVPVGRVAQELAAARRAHLDVAAMLGEVLSAGAGSVALLPSPAWLVPPPGRNVVVVAAESPESALALFGELRPSVTALGLPEPELADAAVGPLVGALPEARILRLGAMQSPPFDGPADRRSGAPPRRLRP